MRAKWELQASGDEDLSLHTSGGWVYVGWVEPERDGYRAVCMWLRETHEDYPENKLFETAKQARRALKAAATVALIGGLIRAKNF